MQIMVASSSRHPLPHSSMTTLKTYLKAHPDRKFPHLVTAFMSIPQQSTLFICQPAIGLPA